MQPQPKQPLLKNDIIRHLYYQRQLTIPQLRKVINYTIPTLGKVVEELVQRQMLVITGKAASNGGRCAYTYALNSDYACCIVACVERFTMRIAITNLHNEFITPITTVKIGITTPNEMLKILQHSVRTIINNSKINRRQIMGISIAIPGLTDKNSGINYNYFGNANRPVTEIFSKMFPYPVLVQHDMDAITVAEQTLGAGKGVESFLYLYIGGTGIGMGMVLNGKLYRGVDGMAGEIGHIPIIDNNKLCHCGKKGCPETEISEAALVSKILENIRGGASTALNSYVAGGNYLTLQQILQALHSGDRFTINLFAQVSEHLSRIITIMLHMFNPEVIILGGELMAAGQYLLNPLQQHLNRYALPQLLKNCKIITSTIGDNASLLGNVSFMMEYTLENNKFFAADTKEAVSSSPQLD
ncbi:MAG: ROK family protein [Prevotellaceae bacterium]|jgi:predicted NBD/HSP70 family sugar kinase|nr:ROK family protein [Prevotellaceae bacterium]